ncbi:uroporphyrinogen-III synthase [Craterilacuibacter sp.]|uniref:uroporphyrinogen-III synthase n=1 Tax=Craterilacuibacter sp. TaxID=2870909 RepID=UPI003F40DDFB
MKPLLLLTRPAAQCAALAARCAAAGFDARVFSPLLLQSDPAALASLCSQAAVADWLIPVSPGAIDIMWPALAKGLPAQLRLACVGQGSAGKLAALSGRPVLHPEHASDSEALLALPELADLSGQTVVIVRGETGRALLADTLAARGARILLCEAYHRVACDPGWGALDTGRDVAAIVVTSSDIARALFTSASAEGRCWLARQHFVALHPRIADALSALGAKAVTVAAGVGDEALLVAVQQRDTAV